MRLFSVLISFYILGLMFVACTDVHAENNHHKQVYEAIDLHEHHIDACSPFCFCDCCQTICQPEFYLVLTPALTFTVELNSYLTYSEYTIYFPFWRPPEI